LLAKDVLAILHHEKFDRAAVVGFSGGGVTACYLAAYFPESVTTVVSMAGGLNSKGRSAEMKEERRKLTYDDLAKNAAGFVAERKKLMPGPDRFPELVERLKARWLADTFVEDEKAKAIKAPVLVVAGDQDDTAGLLDPKS
jgi:pimeloyl-ACP methyl ester carboxylesterase